MTNAPWHRMGISLDCPACSTREREHPGTLTPLTTDPLECIHCAACGHTFTRLDALAHPISFARWAALATHMEAGRADLRPGDYAKVKLASHFDVVGPLVATAQGPILAKASLEWGEAVEIYTSRMPGHPDDQPIGVAWLVFGIQESDKVPGWWLQLFAAIQSAADGRAKPAIIDYAGAFELFVETVLSDALTAKYDAEAADHILNRTQAVTERVRMPLELATGHQLTEDHVIYDAWTTKVKKVRNALAHGGGPPLNPGDAEEAHQATIAAMRWIVDRLP